MTLLKVVMQSVILLSVTKLLHKICLCERSLKEIFNCAKALIILSLTKQIVMKILFANLHP